MPATTADALLLVDSSYPTTFCPTTFDTVKKGQTKDYNFIEM